MSEILVTGGGGFIGSNLARHLISLGESVRILDDFSTGNRDNLEDILDKCTVFEGSICEPGVLRRAIEGAQYCLHQAAIPSVPRSVKDPARSHHANMTGTMNVLLAARDAGVSRVVMASSSSVYGIASHYPVEESMPACPISPYAVSKAAAEMYAKVFSDLYEMDIVALRYFNVFGPRQDPESQYSAVIPKFISRMLEGKSPSIYGDGSQTRDFTFVENVISANIKACAAPGRIAGIYNIAGGTQHSLLDLVHMINDVLNTRIIPEFHPPRTGDVPRSFADVSRARDTFGYEPVVPVREGLERTVAWYEALASEPQVACESIRNQSPAA